MEQCKEHPILIENLADVCIRLTKLETTESERWTAHNIRANERNAAVVESILLVNKTQETIFEKFSELQTNYAKLAMSLSADNERFKSIDKRLVIYQWLLGILYTALTGLWIKMILF